MPKGLSGSTTVSGFTVEYHEIKQNPGGGPRGLGVGLKDHPGSKFKFYPINPNPHDNSSYNNTGNQAKFYKVAATHVANGFSFSDDDITSDFPGLPQKPYNPREMNALLSNPLGKLLTSKTDWGSMGPDEQRKFVQGYPTKIAEHKASKAKKEAGDEWVKHLRTKNNSTFTWERVTYHLPNVQSGDE
jgi:hypothetical protein